jgi:sugar O-acyltransferase (sialic acid O-acetyltransferase NeuD family)
MAILIVGAGGLGREVLAVFEARRQPVAGFLVDAGHRTQPVHGIPVWDDTAIWQQRGDTQFVIAIGDGRIRARLAQTLDGATFAGAVHPAATIGPHVAFGDGPMILGPANFTTDIAVGDHVLINPGCTIAHDCVIGSFVSLGPRVSLAGGAIVEEGANIGTGAVVAPRCRIGAWAVVGAGAVVIGDVAPGSTVAGVPARPLAPSPSR